MKTARVGVQSEGKIYSIFLRECEDPKEVVRVLNSETRGFSSADVKNLLEKTGDLSSVSPWTELEGEKSLYETDSLPLGEDYLIVFWDLENKDDFAWEIVDCEEYYNQQVPVTD